MNRIPTFKTAVIVLLCFTIILTMSMGIPGFVTAEATAGKSAVILFTSDLHANFLPLKADEGESHIELGGYSRLKNEINTAKALYPDALLVDAGDFSMGTLFQTLFASDAADLKIMGQMGYDVTTLGNHEFDFKWDGLAASLNAAKEGNGILPSIVASNYTFPEDTEGTDTQLDVLKEAFEAYPVKDYIIIDRGGCKIGIFGLLGTEAASNAPMSGVVYGDAEGSAKRVVSILREQEKVDLVICLSHSGLWDDKSLSEDEILAEKVPGIDVIISGHTHTRLDAPIIAGKTIIGACGEYSEYLGVIRIAQNTDNSWRVEDYGLRMITSDLPEDGQIAQEISEYKQIIQQEYLDRYGLGFDQILAHTAFDFTPFSKFGRTLTEETLGNLITDSYIYAVKKAEGGTYEPITAAILPKGIVRSTLYEGDIKVSGIFNVNPLGVGPDGISGYPLISVYLTGKEIRTACEVDASVSAMMPDAQLYMSGISYVINPNRLIFNKVTEVSITGIDGSSIKPEDSRLYRIVVDLYSAQMLSVVGKKSFGLLSIVPKKKDATAITDFEEQIIYAQTAGEQHELKAWTATADYLSSFDKAGGVPQVPELYRNPAGRKVIEDNKNIIAVISNPNGITITLYAIIFVLAGLLAFTIYRIATRKRRKMSRMATM